MFIFSLYYLVASMFHQWNVQNEWREERVEPFDELILSWNGTRPEKGGCRFFVKVKTNDWSPWLLYASWGKSGQGGSIESIEDSQVRVVYDAVEILSGVKACGFQIKVESEGGAPLSNIKSLHVYTNSECSEDEDRDFMDKISISLSVEGLSQMEVCHPRSRDLCSPTSTTAALRFMTGNREIDPLIFAKGVYDETYDIFGNWVLNVAEGSTWLDKSFGIWVARLRGFSSIYQQMEKGFPVVVSVKGPLSGSALPYEGGHLLVVRGYDSSRKKVLCMDPAFSTKHETLVEYDLNDFEKAWGRRGRVAYVFCKKENLIE